ncbi:MAG TPA: helix-turn-helix transcriptional regulator [Thermoanaerobaculia bacterium]|jgi:transcriptional regulator with XRE-family HTH domain
MAYREQIRAARLSSGLTYSELERLTGIGRQHLRSFEEGGNITVASLEKILSAIPGLPPLVIGNTVAVMPPQNLPELHQTIVALSGAVQHVRALVEEMLAASEIRVVDTATSRVDPALAQELLAEDSRLEQEEKAAAKRGVRNAKRSPRESKRGTAVKAKKASKKGRETGVRVTP